MVPVTFSPTFTRRMGASCFSEAASMSAKEPSSGCASSTCRAGRTAGGASAGAPCSAGASGGTSGLDAGVAAAALPEALGTGGSGRSVSSRVSTTPVARRTTTSGPEGRRRSGPTWFGGGRGSRRWCNARLLHRGAGGRWGTGWTCLGGLPRRALGPCAVAPRARRHGQRGCQASHLRTWAGASAGRTLRISRRSRRLKPHVTARQTHPGLGAPPEGREGAGYDTTRSRRQTPTAAPYVLAPPRAPALPSRAFGRICALGPPAPALSGAGAGRRHRTPRRRRVPA